MHWGVLVSYHGFCKILASMAATLSVVDSTIDSTSDAVRTRLTVSDVTTHGLRRLRRCCLLLPSTARLSTLICRRRVSRDR